MSTFNFVVASSLNGLGKRSQGSEVTDPNYTQHMHPFPGVTRIAICLSDDSFSLAPTYSIASLLHYVNSYLLHVIEYVVFAVVILIVCSIMII
jgi:hypothetical protein